MKYIFVFILINNIFPFTYNLTLEPDTLFIGSILNIKLEVNNLDKDQIPIFSDFNSDNSNYTQIDKKLTKSSVIYKLQLWKTGIIKLPQLKMKINSKNGMNDSINILIKNINVQSYLSGSENQIKNIKKSKNIKLNSNYRIALLVLFCSFGIIAVFYLIKTKKNLNKKLYDTGRYNKTSIKITLDNINKLEKPLIINKENAELYYLNLSMILKNFIGSIFYVRATEMTTSEITQYFNSKNIEIKIISKWERIIKKLDNVKYAFKTPTQSELDQDLIELISLIKLLNIK